MFSNRYAALGALERQCACIQFQEPRIHLSHTLRDVIGHLRTPSHHLETQKADKHAHFWKKERKIYIYIYID